MERRPRFYQDVMFNGAKSGALQMGSISLLGCIALGLESNFKPGFFLTESKELQNLSLEQIALVSGITVPLFTSVGALTGYVNEHYLLPTVNYIFDRISSKIH